MFSARAPHARLIVLIGVLAILSLFASPGFAQPRPVPPAVTATNPLEMTRDAAASNAGAPDPRSPVGDVGRLNPAGQIARMIGALVVVLLLILGGAHFVRRSPLMAQVPGNAAAQIDLSFPGTLKAAFSFLSPLAALKPLKRAGAQLRAITSAAPIIGSAASSAPLDPGPLRLSGAHALPGSASSVYLVQVGTKGFLLGASATGPIQVLSEIEGLEAAAPVSMTEALREQDEDEAFEALLREQMIPVPERGETRVVQSVVERLNQTHERLSRRLSDGTTASQDRISI